MVMEAVGKGVIVTPLSTNVAGYRGRVEWYTSREDIPEAERMALVQFAQQELGKEYDTWKLVLISLYILLKKNPEARDRLRREHRLFCSYYVAQAYNAIGRDLKKGVSDRFMTPDHIAKSERLKRMGVLSKAKGTLKKEKYGGA
jgi:hypothetical protein